MLLNYNDFLNELKEFKNIIESNETKNSQIEKARFGLGICFINTDFENKVLKPNLQELWYASRFGDASRRMELLLLKSYERTYVD